MDDAKWGTRGHSTRQMTAPPGMAINNHHQPGTVPTPPRPGNRYEPSTRNSPADVYLSVLSLLGSCTSQPACVHASRASGAKRRQAGATTTKSNSDVPQFWHVTSAGGGNSRGRSGCSGKCVEIESGGDVRHGAARGSRGMRHGQAGDARLRLRLKE